MLIRYTGKKLKKTLDLNHKIYEFAPNCDVVDKEALKFLLSDDRKGLFIMDKPNAPESQSEAQPTSTPETTMQGEKFKRSRGRPRKGDR